MREGLLDLLIAVAASSGLSSFIVALLSRGERRSKQNKVDIDSTQVAVDIWKKTAEGLDEKLDKLKIERDELLIIKAERDDLLIENNRLRRKLENSW